MSPMLLLVALLTAHAFADYAGQGDFMAKAKNRTAPIPGVPWWQAMTAHSVIHGGLVALITGIWFLGVFEAISHFVTDDAKCQGRISYNYDQAIHVGCKFAWWGIALAAT